MHVRLTKILMSRKRKGREIHGILLINKPSGYSSNKVLQRIKWLLQAQKAGHTGALDPLATGLLPLCFGEATKFSQILLESDKAYQTVAKLGIITDSADADGNVVETRPVGNYSIAQIQRVLDEHFTGNIRQAAPIYSALKVNGVPMYELARQGIEVEAKVRDATVYSAEVLAVDGDEVTLNYRVSKGTYIRSLVADLGQLLGCGAHVHKLHRTAHGPWSVAQATPWQAYDFANEDVDVTELESLLLPMDSGIVDMPIFTLNDEQAQRVKYGNAIAVYDDLPVGTVRIYYQNELLGLGELTVDQQLKPVRMLNIGELRQ